MDTNAIRQATQHHIVEERTSLTPRELFEMCEDAWQRGYNAAHKERDESHNQSMKGYDRKWANGGR